ncbi:MAG: biosynthetic peptidoglycan transglycosylase, partial [Deltaproteobacteria bacterium]
MKLFFILTLFCLYAIPANALPTFQEVKSSYKKSDALLLDRHGEVIHELRVDPKGRRLDWVGLKEISPSLIKAVLYSEDKRFYEHGGVDWKAIGASVIKNLFTDKRRGASTITMQVASRLEKSLQPKGGKRTFGQKWEQIKAAGEIEEVWSKDQIIEAYLNLITFRGELQGIGAASRGLFDKEPGGLDEAESVILASLIRSPNASVADVAKRGCVLSKTMNAASSCEGIKKLAEGALSGPYNVRPNVSLAYHLAH